MTVIWTDPVEGSFRDAYLDWAALLKARREPETRTDPLFEPIFVRLVADLDDATKPRCNLRDALAREGSPLLMDRHEAALLHTRIVDDPFHALPDEYMLYRRVGVSDDDHADLFEVLDTGIPVEIKADSQTDAFSPCPTDLSSEVNPGSGTGAPIVAAIDDGIGFLNHRFCREDGTTRFHAIWLQALESVGDTGGIVAGEVLDRASINAAITQCQTTGGETDVYAALNSRLFPNQGRRATDFATSHGTHVLDLAAGALRDAPEAEWPLLAVSLPPEAIDDTSGTRCESYLVMGMRWILQQARVVDASAPVIVNISLGILAGPKNGARFAEYQIAQEAAAWEEATGQPVRVVWSFGNNHRDALQADFRFDDEAHCPRTQHITWCVQPADKTANFLEIHPRSVGTPLAQNMDASRFSIGLKAPDGTDSGLRPIPVGMFRTLECNGAALARIYHVPARDYGADKICPAHYVLALAPTSPKDLDEPLAPAGGWTVSLHDTGGVPAAVSLQIQRDDAPRGNRGEARQSYFDAPDSYGWDSDLMAYLAPKSNCAITFSGAHNALASVRAPQIFRAGAATRAPRTEDWDACNYMAARYSAQGSDWSVSGPTVSLVTEDGLFAGGVLGAGTQSGTARFLSGTSAAAGRLSRALAMSSDGIKCHGLVDGDCDLASLSRTGITLVPVPQAQQSRLGAYVIEIDSATTRLS